MTLLELAALNGAGDEVADGGLAPAHRGSATVEFDRGRSDRRVNLYSVATIDFMARGGDDYISFRDAEPVLPPADSPTIAYEVIDYIKSIGTIRTAVDGRIVLRS